MKSKSSRHKILIDIVPAIGHFNGILKLALLLKDAGNEVVFLNMWSLRGELKKYGFESINSIDFTSPVLLSRRKFDSKLFFDKIFIAKKQLKKDIYGFNEFRKVVERFSPDIVLLDEQTMLKTIYYELCNLPVISVETMPDPCKFDNVPPFTSFFIPTNTWASKLFCKSLWLKKYTLNLVRLKIFQINSFWTDAYSVAMKISIQAGNDIKSKIDLRRSFGIGYKAINRFVLAPEAFDFFHAQKENTYNIGPLLDINREGEIAKPRYISLLNKLKKHIDNEGKSFVVYCSMGTITANFKKKVKKFFLKMKKVARLNPEFLFVLSTGKNFDINELFPAPDNLFIFDQVPQVDLLQYCDVMITHGGMNSITECVFCEVPVLVYPLSLNWDQPGNSARAVYHGFALRGKIEKDSAKTISTKLNQIKFNYSLYKNNVIELKKKFEEKNNSNEVIEIIENILNKTKRK